MSTLNVTNLKNEASASNNLTLDSNGRVGIGEATPGAPLHVDSASNNAPCVIEASATNRARIIIRNNLATGNQITLEAYDEDFRITTNSGERIRILKNGGLTFNGDTAAANALDDYEEGTFTPVLLGSGSESGQTYNYQGGQYTKIGNMVTCRFNIRLSTEGTFSGTYCLLGGLPFNIQGAVAGGVNTVGAGFIYHVSLGTSVYGVGLQMLEQDNKAYFWVKTTLGTSREYLTGSQLCTDTSELSGTLVYQTTS